LGDPATALLEVGVGVPLGVLDDAGRLLLGDPQPDLRRLIGLVANRVARSLGSRDDRPDPVGYLRRELMLPSWHRFLIALFHRFDPFRASVRLANRTTGIDEFACTGRDLAPYRREPARPRILLVAQPS